MQKETSADTVAPTQGQKVRVPNATQSDDVTAVGAKVTRRMQLRRDRDADISGSSASSTFVPAKSRRGATASDRLAEAGTGGTEMAGPRTVYLLARRESPEFETPVFAEENNTQGEALVVFTTQDKAALYLQTARWDDYIPQGLSAIELKPCLSQAHADGISVLLIDPNRHAQERGASQPALSLQRIGNLTGEGIYEEIWALGNP